MKKSSHTIATYESFEAKSLKARTRVEYLVDMLVSRLGSFGFLMCNAVFFIGWILINTGLIPLMSVFDPYPFGMLTMLVSLEAIFLSILVLVGQNRNMRTDILREEAHMQLNYIAEKEITKVLLLLTKIAHKAGVDVRDPEIRQMLTDIDPAELEKEIASQIKSADPGGWTHGDSHE